MVGGRTKVRRLVLGAAGVAVAMAYTQSGVLGVGSSAEPRIVFTIGATTITESSSLAVSTAHPGLVYTSNDSGDGPYVYVLNMQGELVGTTTLAGVDPVDIEALSIGRDGTLVVADIGDNNSLRPSVAVYKIPQPTVGNHTVTPDTLRLFYPDRPHNAESVMYDAKTGRVIVVSKSPAGSIYRSPPQVFSMASTRLTEVASAPVLATDATLLPGSAAVVVRTYRDAVIYHYPSFDFWMNLDLPTQQMGESISAVPGRQVVYAGSEGVNSPVWSVPLPALPAAGARVTPGAPTHEPTTHEPTTHEPRTGGTAGNGPTSGPRGGEDRRAVVSATKEPAAGWSVGRLSTSPGAPVVAAGAVAVGLVVLLSRARRRRSR